MNEVKQYYRELKDRVEVLESFISMRGVLAMMPGNYLGSESQINDTKNLHEFADFMSRLIDEVDIESTSPQLDEMKQKMVGAFEKLIYHLEHHKNWVTVIEPDLTIKQRENYIKMLWSTQMLNEGKGTTLSPANQIRYIHSMLLVLKSELTKEGTKEPDLPAIDASLKNASHFVVLLNELGILEYLKTKYDYVPAQRLGELCQLITGQKTEYFREAFGHYDPEKCRAFNEKSRRAVASQLVMFGINPPGKKDRN